MKKKLIVIVAAFLMVTLIVAGAYTATRLLAGATQTSEQQGSQGRVVDSVMVANDGQPVAVRTTILPASELPTENSAASGILVSRQDSTLIIGTGDVELEADIEVDGETGQQTVNLAPRTNGPQMEVVVTNATLLYRDITDFAMSDETESGEQSIQQAVTEAGSLEELGDNAEIQVWGESRGGRVVADVLVFGPLAGGAFE